MGGLGCGRGLGIAVRVETRVETSLDPADTSVRATVAGLEVWLVRVLDLLGALELVSQCELDDARVGRGLDLSERFIDQIAVGLSEPRPTLASSSSHCDTNSNAPSKSN